MNAESETLTLDDFATLLRKEIEEGQRKLAKVEEVRGMLREANAKRLILPVAGNGFEPEVGSNGHGSEVREVPPLRYEPSLTQQPALPLAEQPRLNLVEPFSSHETQPMRGSLDKEPSPEPQTASSNPGKTCPVAVGASSNPEGRPANPEAEVSAPAAQAKTRVSKKESTGFEEQLLKIIAENPGLMRNEICEQYKKSLPPGEEGKSPEYISKVLTILERKKVRIRSKVAPNGWKRFFSILEPEQTNAF